jgi:hypothetical protein
MITIVQSPFYAHHACICFPLPCIAIRTRMAFDGPNQGRPIKACLLILNFVATADVTRASNPAAQL